MYCPKHPNEETYLRCARCDTPICAKCRVSTPVGFRCYDCANVQSVPTYALDTSVYVRAAAFGLVVGGAAGVLMGLFPGFEFWTALLMGIAVPEAVAAGANQKRGPGLQMVAIGVVLFGFIVSRFVLNQLPDLIPLSGINQMSFTGIALLSRLPFQITQYSILWLALALFFSYKRLQ